MLCGCDAVDVLAFETVPELQEAEAICQLMREEMPEALFWVSLQCKDGERLGSGALLRDVVVSMLNEAGAVTANSKKAGVDATSGSSDCNPNDSEKSNSCNNGCQLVGIGVNCTEPNACIDAVKTIHAALAEHGLVSNLDILCYPNSGGEWDGDTQTWQQGGAPMDVTLIKALLQAGATIVGGCCRVHPDAVKVIRSVADGVRDE